MSERAVQIGDGRVARFDQVAQNVGFGLIKIRSVAADEFGPSIASDVHARHFTPRRGRPAAA